MADSMQRGRERQGRPEFDHTTFRINQREHRRRSIANSERRQCERPEQQEADRVASRSCQRENRRRQITGK